jgi:cell division transport system ATP-binding protein
MKEVVILKNAGIYQEGVKVLSEVNLSVSQTEFVYLIGKTGSGKSSLMRTLWGDIPLKEGDGQVADISLTKLLPSSIPLLRRRVGMVFQDFQLFQHWSVADNLRFVLDATGTTDEKEQNKIISDVCTDVHLSDNIHKPVHQLSGGEQQRAVIARAVINKPQILLADEPTGILIRRLQMQFFNSCDALQLNIILQYLWQRIIHMSLRDFRGECIEWGMEEL